MTDQLPEHHAIIPDADLEASGLEVIKADYIAYHAEAERVISVKTAEIAALVTAIRNLLSLRGPLDAFPEPSEPQAVTAAWNTVRGYGPGSLEAAGPVHRRIAELESEVSFLREAQSAAVVSIVRLERELADARAELEVLSGELQAVDEAESLPDVQK